jgi:transcriptional regulator with XRE-family HTH domain
MVTLKDIAREANVSLMTVSNVVNGNLSKVSKEKAELIQAILKKGTMFRIQLPGAWQKPTPASLRSCLEAFMMRIR